MSTSSSSRRRERSAGASSVRIPVTWGKAATLEAKGQSELGARFRQHQAVITPKGAIAMKACCAPLSLSRCFASGVR